MLRHLAAVAVLAAAQTAASVPSVDEAALLRDLQVLSADDMAGRKPGTAGHARARRFIAGRFAASGLEPMSSGFEQSFPGGANVTGRIRGSRRADRSIAITAHYDHLGVVNGEVFNGADDNASGTAGLIALAAHFRRSPPAHTLVFGALDLEEANGRGARVFVEALEAGRTAVVLNVNLDMIARDATNTLYAAGTSHYPFLKPYLERVAARAPVGLRFGHDGPGAPAIADWTRDSDHYAFHRRGIPFVYFGVEDPVHHHKVTDDYDTITHRFFVDAVRTIADAVTEFDTHAEAILRQRAATGRRPPGPSRPDRGKR
ncbi:MAG TPA: M28 family peptidase [Vicinamibacterales bacterium]|nr:M28 family peptidase [Vicinamibacterales bacterium]